MDFVCALVKDVGWSDHGPSWTGISWNRMNVCLVQHRAIFGIKFVVT